MPLVARRSLVRASLAWQYVRPASPFATGDQRQQHLQPQLLPDATVINHALAQSFPGLAASATQIVDFYGPTTAPSGELVTATKAQAVLVVAACTGGTVGGKLKIEPDATNPLLWPFTVAGPTTGPKYTLTPAAAQAAFWLHSDGSVAVVSPTARRWLLTNIGTAALDVSVVPWVGT